MRWLLPVTIRRVRIRRSLRGSPQDYANHKVAAKQLAQDRLTYFNRQYGFTFKRVSIKNQASRWGSCSKLGNLNFHYRIATLPAQLADYVIVHELCHLQEMNHSKQFWQLVAKSIPDYRERRRQLRNRDLLITQGTNHVLLK